MRISWTTYLGVHLVSASLLSISAGAQAPRTEAGARAAAIQYFRSMNPTIDSTRFAADSASMYRDFVRCSITNGKTLCALTEEKPVEMVRVRLVTPDTAAINVLHYRMLSGRCPNGGSSADSRIASTGGVSFTMAYTDGVWKYATWGTSVRC